MDTLDNQLISAAQAGDLTLIHDLTLRGASTPNTGEVAINKAFDAGHMKVVRYFISFGFRLSI